MGLWKRGNVYWAYFYVDGVRHQRSTGTSNKRQAEQLFNKFREEANAKRHRLVHSSPNITFGEIAIRFAGSTAARPRHIYHLKILLPFFGEIPVARLTKSHAEEFRQWRRSERGVKDSTVNRDLSVMRHVLYWAVDELLIHANPWSRLRMAREVKTPTRIFNVPDEDRLLPFCPEHLREIVATALDTGMRRGEITHQLWEHIDLTRGLLMVTRSKTPEGEAREIPLTERLQKLLAARKQDSGLVFSFRGNKIQTLKTSWTAALKRAGLPHFTFHGLRHTFNTRLLEAGVMREVRMALMGHSASQSVHSIYTHVELPLKRQAIARLEQWVRTQRQESATGDDNASPETPREPTRESNNSSDC